MSFIILYILFCALEVMIPRRGLRECNGGTLQLNTLLNMKACSPSILKSGASTR